MSVLAVLLVALPFVSLLLSAPAGASPATAGSSLTLLVENDAHAITTCGDTEEAASTVAWPTGRDRHRTAAEPDKNGSAGSPNDYTAQGQVGLPAPHLAPRAVSAAQSSAALQVFRC